MDKFRWDARSDCWHCRSVGCCIAVDVKIDMIKHCKDTKLDSMFSFSYQLPPFPRLHGHFVLFKFMAPIRVDFLVVVRFARRCTPLHIDGDIVAAQSIRS